MTGVQTCALPISNRQANAERLDELINRFQQRLPGLRLTLCLQDNVQAPSEQLLALHGSETREVCARSDCDTCERKNNPSQATFGISNQGKLQRSTRRKRSR